MKLLHTSGLTLEVTGRADDQPTEALTVDKGVETFEIRSFPDFVVLAELLLSCGWTSVACNFRKMRPEVVDLFEQSGRIPDELEVQLALGVNAPTGAATEIAVEADGSFSLRDSSNRHIRKVSVAEAQNLCQGGMMIQGIA